MNSETNSQLRKGFKKATEEWWNGVVYHQIYPRSFFDSNSNGIDLQGIIKKLPYVASLGVDAVWVSPFFKSPTKDGGYDISDYRDVDAEFGTIQDFEDLWVIL